jgi:hypothetical protein
MDCLENKFNQRDNKTLPRELIKNVIKDLEFKINSLEKDYPKMEKMTASVVDVYMSGKKSGFENSIRLLKSIL